MKTVKKFGKKTFAILMTILMVMSAWVFVAPTDVEALTFTDYFFVPETIYLKPSDNKTFQYYVNRSQDTTGTLSTSQDTSGKIYFNSNRASKVTISCSGASVSLGASSASSTTLSTTFTGSLSSAITQGNTSVITWTATITGTDGVTYHQYAYTVCYAPNRNVVAAGATGFDYNSSEAYASSMIWLQGVHNAVPAFGHQYESEVTVEPTDKEEGVRTYRCTICKHSYTEQIPVKAGSVVCSNHVSSICTTYEKHSSTPILNVILGIFHTLSHLFKH